MAGEIFVQNLICSH